MPEENYTIVPAGPGAGAVSGRVEAWEVNEVLKGLVEKIGDSIGRLEKTTDFAQWTADAKAGIQPADTQWWDALSSVVRALDGTVSITGNARDKGFYDRLVDLSQTKGVDAAYLEIETDFLRFDPKGERRQFDTDYPQPILLQDSAARLSLIRVTAFSLLRAELAKQDVALPDNPVLAEAKAAVELFFKRPFEQAAAALGFTEKTQHPRLGPGGDGTKMR